MPELLAMLASAWPDTTWAQGRMVLDLARVVPGLGLLTGLGADLMTAWDDVAAVPTGDPVIAGLTDGLIVVRSGVSTVSNGAQAVLELGQLAQYALGTLTTAEGAAASFGGVTAPAAVITGLETLTALVGNTAVGFVLAETDGVLIWLDGLITFDATIWANMGRTAPSGDGGLEPGEPQSHPGSEIGFDSFSVARAPPDDPAADAEWRAARSVELDAMRACAERGESFLGVVASDWAELLEAGAAMTEDTAGAPDALAALREQLPACASELEGRRASVEDIAGRLAAGMEDVDAFQGRLDGVAATIDTLSLPLEELPDGAAGAAIQAILEPVASALETAKETAIAPLRDLQGSLAELRELLGQVAAAAEQTV